MATKKTDKTTTAKKSKIKELEAVEAEEVSPAAEGAEKEVPEIDSKYRLILLAAQRSKQLQKGADVRVNVDARKHKATHIALKEVREKKVNFEFTEEE
jgi:DNA-directed RNA polymerase omega subunit